MRKRIPTNPTDDPPRETLPAGRVVPLLFFSGFCALVYQVAWLRSLRDVFGASTAASAAVLAVFMAGLGSGGLLLGKRIERARAPLFVYAGLELGIGVVACATPLLVQLARATYLALGGVETLGMTGATVVRLILTAVVLGLPTVLMGGTLPAAARAVTPPVDPSRRAVAALYGANTIGAVCGAMAANFILLEVFGTRMTLWMAGLVNILVGLAGRFVARSSATLVSDVSEPAKKTGEHPTWAAPVAAAVSGFAFLLMELVWYRMLTPLLGGSSYTFGLILAVALAGIGAGGIAYARVAPKATLGLFGVTCALEAACMALPYALGDRVAVLAILLRPLGALGFSGHVGAWTAILCVVVLPASLVSGFQFPLSIALFRAGRGGIARSVALAYAANTVGSIAGSLAGGFGLLPLLTAPGCWRLVAGLLLAVAVVYAALGFVRFADPRRQVIGALAASAATFGMLLARGPTALWRHSPIGAGRADFVAANGTTNNVIAFVRNQRRHVRWQADGVESAIGLSSQDSYDFIVGGKSDGNALGDAATQVLSGLIGSALRPDSKSALVVGLGTGSTAGWLGALPNMTDVDVIEIEPAITHVAEVCAPVNQRVLENPKVHLRIGDARELLLTTKRKYDLIFSEPSNPYRAGVSSFFTQDFYRSASTRLSDDGIFLQWLQMYEVDGFVVRSVVSTFASVFPHVAMWETQPGDVLLVATKQPMVIELDRLRQTLAGEPYKTAMRGVWGMDDAEGFLAHHMANDDLARAIMSLGAEPNTDDRNALEYAFARNVGHGALGASYETWGITRVRKTDRPRVVGDVDWDHVEERRMITGSAVNRDEPAATAPPALRAYYAALKLHAVGKLAESARAWRDSGHAPGCLAEKRIVAEAFAEGGSLEDAQGAIDALASIAPTEAHLARARLLARTKKPAEAASELEAGFEGFRGDPWVPRPMVARAMALAMGLARDPALRPRLREALGKPFVVAALDDERARTRTEMVQPGDPACVEVFAALEPSTPWDHGLMQRRYDCYREQSAPLSKLAGLELLELVSNEPSKVSAGVLDAPFFQAGP